MNRPKIITVVGPTASGKTNLARRLALTYNGELVSADSRQVYRGLDIGTGKEGVLTDNKTSPALAAKYPSLRYLEGDVPQWLIDIAEPSENYTVAEFQKAAYEIIDDIVSRDKLPIIVGGTGLYVTALLEGYDFSEQATRDRANPRHTDKTNYQKTPPDWNTLELGIDLPREELYSRIDQRVDDRISQGMIEEAKTLIANGVATDRLRQFGLEYRFLADYIENKLTFDEFSIKLKTAIHQFARRQLTWWRHHGRVQWVLDYRETEALVSKFIKHSLD